MKRVIYICIAIAGVFIIAFLSIRIFAPKKIQTFDAPLAAHSEPQASQTFTLAIAIKHDGIIEIDGAQTNIEGAARIISEKKWDDHKTLKITHDASLPYPTSTVVALLDICRKYGVSQITVD